MNTEQMRIEFEKRTVPNWNLKKTPEGTYYYLAVQASFNDFCDGWQAALSAKSVEADKVRELENVFVEAKNLCEVKGRYHSEIAMKRLQQAIEAMKG